MTIALMALCLVVISAIMLTARTALSPLDLELPRVFQPGHVLPPDVSNFREYYRSLSGVTGYVDPANDQREYIVELDMPGRTIHHVSKWVFDSRLTLGDLILRWGTPTGQRGSFVEWDDRSAFVLSDLGFQPSSEVYFISYGSSSEDLEPWTGFAHSRSDTTTLSIRELASLFPLRP